MRFYYSIPVALIGVVAIAQTPMLMTFASDIQINENAKQATVRVDLNNTPEGSGVIFAQQGNVYYVLTAYHVVDKPGAYSVRTYSDRKSHPINPSSIVRLSGVDLAILQFESPAVYTIINPVKSQGLQLTERSDIWIVGYSRLAIGGAIEDPQISTGKITSVPVRSFDAGYNLAYNTYNNSTAEGMSGGPILNQQGNLIGIHGRGFTEQISNIQTKPNQPSYGTSINAFNERAEKAFYDLGTQNLKQQNYSRAIADFTMALSNNPKVAENSYIGRGYAHLEMGNYEQAKKDADRAININPSSVAANQLRDQITERSARANPTPAPQRNDDLIAIRPTPNRALLNTLAANSRVYSVAFSPDGKILASGTEDGKIKLWQPNGKVPIHTFSGHTTKVWSVAFSRDGRFIASGDAIGITKVWDVQTRREIKTFRDPKASPNSITYVISLAFGQGNDLAIGLSNGNLNIWQVDSGKLIFERSAHVGDVSALVYSPDGQTLVSGGADKRIMIWNVRLPAYQALSQTLTEHRDLIFSLAFSSDGRTYVSSSRDDTIKIWDINQKKSRLTIKAGPSLREVAIHQDRKTLASSNESEIKLWNLADGKLLNTLQGHTGTIRSVAFSSDGKLASGSEDGNIMIWQPK